jgi:uncharacterized protein YoxC
MPDFKDDASAKLFIDTVEQLMKDAIPADMNAAKVFDRMALIGVQMNPTRTTAAAMLSYVAVIAPIVGLSTDTLVKLVTTISDYSRTVPEIEDDAKRYAEINAKHQEAQAAALSSEAIDKLLKDLEQGLGGLSIVSPMPKQSM